MAEIKCGGFLATGIASAVPEMLGKPYIDSNGYEYGNMLGQPMLVFEGIYLVYKKRIGKQLSKI